VYSSLPDRNRQHSFSFAFAFIPRDLKTVPDPQLPLVQIPPWSRSPSCWVETIFPYFRESNSFFGPLYILCLYHSTFFPNHALGDGVETSPISTCGFKCVPLVELFSRWMGTFCSPRRTLLISSVILKCVDRRVLFYPCRIPGSFRSNPLPQLRQSLFPGWRHGFEAG